MISGVCQWKKGYLLHKQPRNWFFCYNRKLEIFVVEWLQVSYGFYHFQMLTYQKDKTHGGSFVVIDFLDLNMQLQKKIKHSKFERNPPIVRVIR